MASVNPQSDKEIGHRIADLRRERRRSAGNRGWTQKTVAEELGVVEGTVTAWENGYQKPEGENLVRLAQLLGTTPHFILHGDYLGPGVDVRIEPEAIELFGSIDEVVRHVRGIAPPGQSQARKLAAVEALERAAAAFGWTLPDWFFGLRQRIQDGEL